MSTNLWKCPYVYTLYWVYQKEHHTYECKFLLYNNTFAIIILVQHSFPNKMIPSSPNVGQAFGYQGHFSETMSFPKFPTCSTNVQCLAIFFFYFFGTEAHNPVHVSATDKENSLSRCRNCLYSIKANCDFSAQIFYNGAMKGK